MTGNIRRSVTTPDGSTSSSRVNGRLIRSWSDSSTKNTKIFVSSAKIWSVKSTSSTSCQSSIWSMVSAPTRTQNRSTPSWTSLSKMSSSSPILSSLTVNKMIFRRTCSWSLVPFLTCRLTKKDKTSLMIIFWILILIPLITPETTTISSSSTSSLPSKIWLSDQLTALLKGRSHESTLNSRIWLRIGNPSSSRNRRRTLCDRRWRPSSSNTKESSRHHKPRKTSILIQSFPLEDQLETLKFQGLYKRAEPKLWAKILDQWWEPPKRALLQLEEMFLKRDKRLYHPSNNNQFKELLNSQSNNIDLKQSLRSINSHPNLLQSITHHNNRLEHQSKFSHHRPMLLHMLRLSHNHNTKRLKLNLHHNSSHFRPHNMLNKTQFSRFQLLKNKGVQLLLDKPESQNLQWDLAHHSSSWTRTETQCQRDTLKQELQPENSNLEEHSANTMHSSNKMLNTTVMTRRASSPKAHLNNTKSLIQSPPRGSTEESRRQRNERSKNQSWLGAQSTKIRFRLVKTSKTIFGVRVYAQDPPIWSSAGHSPRSFKSILVFL